MNKNSQMGLATDIPSEHSLSSTASSPNSIISRKRELKAIPGSFSYNLGRRGSGFPPRLDTSLEQSPSRSVKSIVAWIESSDASKRSSRLSASDDDGATLRSNASSHKLHGCLEASPSRQPNSGSTASARVDSDCPTFLDYQQYFSQESLARCLDEPSTAAAALSKDTDADAAMAYNGRLQYAKDEALARKEEGVIAEKRSSAEVAAL